MALDFFFRKKFLGKCKAVLVDVYIIFLLYDETVAYTKHEKGRQQTARNQTKHDAYHIHILASDIIYRRLYGAHFLVFVLVHRLDVVTHLNLILIYTVLVDCQ